MEPGKIRVISRKSRLALLQVEEILSLLPPHINTEKIDISSWGDCHKEISLLENPPADIFTRELDEAILNNRADIAIHSAKDLPFPLPQGLTVVAVTGGLTGSDSLVSRNHILLDKLPEGAKIGTSSHTRKKRITQTPSRFTGCQYKRNNRRTAGIGRQPYNRCADRCHLCTRTVRITEPDHTNTSF